jgi:hypothetical protein
MNSRRLILAIFVVFVGIWVTDFLIHGVWLQSAYKETMQLWRPEAEMRQKMGWLTFGQFLAGTAFVVLWASGFAAKAKIAGACTYGLFMGLFSQGATLITYAVQPFPAGLIAKWFIVGIAQGILMGLLVYWVYKPSMKEGGE